MHKGVALVFLIVAAGGCKNSSLSGDAQSGAHGTVAGVLLEAGSERPLPDAIISVISGDDTRLAYSDEQGIFRVNGVPPGAFVIEFAADGYESFFFNATLPGNAGGQAVADPQVTLGPLGMVRTSGSFTVRVVDDIGGPAAGVYLTARPRVRWVDYTGTANSSTTMPTPMGAPVARGTYQVTTVSGEDGLAVFTGLPDYNSLYGIGFEYPYYYYYGSYLDYLPIEVPPMQVNGTNGYSFLGGTYNFYVNHLANTNVYPYPPATSVPTVVLAGPRTPLTVLDSNLASLVGSVASAVPSVVSAEGQFAHVAFNEAIDPASVRAELTREDGSVSALQPTATVSTNLLTLEVDQPLDAGQRYNLVLSVQAALNPEQVGGVLRSLRTTAPFFVQPTGDQSPSIVPGSVHVNLDSSGMRWMLFRFSESVGLGSGDTLGAPCVAFYEGCDFDRDATSLFQGEWSTDLAQLQCPSKPAPNFDLTRIQPIEDGQYTGFTTRWQIRLDGNPNDNCKKGVTCSYPPSGTIVHLVFSKADSAHAVRRITGEPLDFLDQSAPISFTIP
jgi:hypothetical protein